MRRASDHVYFNLHKACWSIMLRGKVQRHAGSVLILSEGKDSVTGPVRFVVREGGRKRVLREGKKNVHAFVVGDACTWQPTDSEVQRTLASGAYVEVTYRPTSGPTFTRKDTGAPVHTADAVLMTRDRKVFAYLPA